MNLTFKFKLVFRAVFSACHLLLAATATRATRLTTDMEFVRACDFDSQLASIVAVAVTLATLALLVFVYLCVCDMWQSKRSRG